MISEIKPPLVSPNGKKFCLQVIIILFIGLEKQHQSAKVKITATTDSEYKTAESEADGYNNANSVEEYQVISNIFCFIN